MAQEAADEWKDKYEQLEADGIALLCVRCLIQLVSGTANVNKIKALEAQLNAISQKEKEGKEGKEKPNGKRKRKGAVADGEPSAKKEKKEKQEGEQKEGKAGKGKGKPAFKDGETVYYNEESEPKPNQKGTVQGAPFKQGKFWFCNVLLEGKRKAHQLAVDYLSAEPV